jgi:hypothetical protein
VGASVTARLASISVTMLMTACGLFGSGANPRVSDAEYVTIAQSTPQARAFYAKYSGVQEQVDRSGKLAVDFRAGAARLRIFIENDRVTDAFVECPLGTIRTGDVVAAIRDCP